MNSVPSENRDRRREAPADDPVTRRIVATARYHFFTHGFRGVTMDDLAGELGMSKKTLYLHFPSKSALLQAVLMEKFRDAEAAFEKIGAERVSDFHQRLQQLLACMQQQTNEIQPPFLRDIQREAPELFGQVEIRRRELIRRQFGRFLTEGQESGMIRKDIPIILITEVLLGAVQAIINPRKMAELGLMPKTAFPFIIKVILEGVFSEEGRPKQ